MKTYTIYKLTAPNGNIYIGQTSNINSRFYHYKNLTCSPQKKLYNSILCYGWNNFVKEIIDTDLTKEEANMLEISLISKNKAEGISLNILNGGEATKAWKEVSQFSLEGKFIQHWISIEEIHRNLNLRHQGIRRACSDKYNRYKDYLWLYKEDFEKGKIPTHCNRAMKIPIVQLDLKGRLIQRFNNCREAEQITGINYMSIKKAIYRKELASDFQWLYEKDYNLNSDNVKKTKKGRKL